jgi:histidine triad (HIT) family protein
VAKSCIFCSLIAGADLQAVYRDGNTVAFLDHAPVIPGHMLVVPITHYDTLDDVPDEALAPLFRIVRQVSIAQQRVLGAEGSLTLANTRISQSVPHVHVHVVPRRKGDSLFSPGRTFWMRRQYKEGEAAEIAEKLRAELAKT